MTTSRQLAQARANSQCEAMILILDVVDFVQRQTWTRCGVSPVDCHHRIRRSQGGKLLDLELETRHLICLCREHHSQAHRRVGDATELGLFIDGYVSTDGGQLVYHGTDNYFAEKYGREAQYEVRGLGTAW